MGTPRMGCVSRNSINDSRLLLRKVTPRMGYVSRNQDVETTPGPKGESHPAWGV